MSGWREEPATYTQMLAIRNALDKRYGMRQASDMFAELTKEQLTKGQASDMLDRLYHKEDK